MTTHTHTPDYTFSIERLERDLKLFNNRNYDIQFMIYVMDEMAAIEGDSIALQQVREKAVQALRFTPKFLGTPDDAIPF